MKPKLGVNRLVHKEPKEGLAGGRSSTEWGKEDSDRGASPVEFRERERGGAAAQEWETDRTKNFLSPGEEKSNFRKGVGGVSTSQER